MGEPSCSFSAVARDADEARALMVIDAKRGEAGAYKSEYLAKWIAAGAPVKRISGHFKPPDIYYLHSLLRAKVEAAA